MTQTGQQRTAFDRRTGDPARAQRNPSADGSDAATPRTSAALDRVRLAEMERRRGLAVLLSPATRRSGDRRYILCLTRPSKTRAGQVLGGTVGGALIRVILGAMCNPFN